MRSHHQSPALHPSIHRDANIPAGDKPDAVSTRPDHPEDRDRPSKAMQELQRAIRPSHKTAKHEHHDYDNKNNSHVHQGSHAQKRDGEHVPIHKRPYG
jgi:hypothetical protein